MIVRCKNCSTAFSVDDEKVNNKKFAFSCPKCSAENMIDNRKIDSEVDAGGAVFQEKPEPDEFLPEYQETGESPDIRPTAETVEEDTFESDLEDFGEDSDQDTELSEDEVPETEEVTVPEEISIEDELGGDIEGLDLDIDFDEDKTDEDTMIEDEIPAGVTAPEKGGDIPFDDLDIDINDLEDIDTIPDEKTGVETGDSDYFEDESKVKTAVSDDVSDDLSEESILPELDEIDTMPDDTEYVVGDKLEEEIEEDESITIDLDSLDIELEEDDEVSVTGEEIPGLEIDEVSLEEGVKPEAVGAKAETGEMDIDLSDEELAEIESDLEGIEVSEERAIKEPAADEEDITLDLDSLDIDLDEDETVLEGERPEEMDLEIADTGIHELTGMEADEMTGKDESITLDLDSLDIELEETGDIKKGETLEEDEKITLTDAGLTLDDLTQDEIAASMEDEEEELKLSVDDIDPEFNIDDLQTDTDEVFLEEEDDLKLTVEEIDPSLDMDNLEDEFKEVESAISVTDEEDEIEAEMMDLPEIEEEVDEPVPVGVARGKRITETFDDELMDIDLEDNDIYEKKDYGGNRHPDITRKGAVNFSIDFSIKYSRLGSILRLFGIFTIGLLPHLLVFIIYSILSSILGYLNQIVVLFTGEIIEDFAEIQENTLRYMLYIGTSQMGIVEDMPIYTGKADIDHSLQMNVTYPLHHSRSLAFLRLTGIGIFLFSLPHLIVLGLLSLVTPFIFLAGMLVVLITGGWPHLLYDILTQYYRYGARVLAFLTGLIDDYPPFKFD